MAREVPSTFPENEVRFQEFYLSGEPETTPNYPLLEGCSVPMLPMCKSQNGEIGVYLQQSVTVPGQMLMVENTEISCTCLRDYSLDTEKPLTHTPTTVISPIFDRIPLKARMHLVHKLANLVLRANNSKQEYINLLDARPHPRAVKPVNLHSSMSVESSKGNRGPWKETEAGEQETVDAERVWNIIANNAVCYRVRSKSREEQSEVETCEYWGMWIWPSFINHSCIPNCHAMLVGNAVVIRAAKTIAAGDELTLPYFDIFQPLCKRESAAQRWGFRCVCPRCEFERSIGKPYDAIQEQIVNLEQQIQKFLAWKDAKSKPLIGENLLQKLSEQISPVMDLQNRLHLKSQNRKEDNEIPYVEQSQFDTHSAWIRTSLIQPLIASYAICVNRCTSDEIPQPRDTKARALKAQNLKNVILTVLLILDLLSSVHPGNVVGEEFYAILLKARNELIEYDRDENSSRNLASQELYVTKANQFSRSRYGPLIEIFRP